MAQGDGSASGGGAGPGRGREHTVHQSDQVTHHQKLLQQRQRQQQLHDDASWYTWLGGSTCALPRFVLLLVLFLPLFLSASRLQDTDAATFLSPPAAPAMFRTTARAGSRLRRGDLSTALGGGGSGWTVTEDDGESCLRMAVAVAAASLAGHALLGKRRAKTARRSDHADRDPSVSPLPLASPPQQLLGAPALLSGSQTKALWSIAAPTIAIGLLRSAYGIIDSIWVGRLGAAHLEAMAASSFAFWVLLLLGEVASSGVHAVAAAREGSGSRHGVGEAVVQGLWFSLFCGFFALALRPLISVYFPLLGVELGSEAFNSGSAYLQGMLFGVLPLTASGVLDAGFKGIAELKPVLAVNLICVSLNFVLDPMLMWGLFGLPKLGVVGAAVATNICSSLACLLSCRLLQKHGVPLKFAWPDLKVLRLITRIGAPISLGGVLFTGTYIALGRLLQSLGGANLAALGLGHRVEALAYTTSEGFGAAAATIVGQWLGAGSAQEARKAAMHAARSAATVMLPISLLFSVAAPAIVGLVTSDLETAAAATSYLRIVSFAFPLMGVEHVMDGALTGAGDTTPSLFWGLLLNTLRIPLAIGLSRFWGVHGVWVAIAMTTMMKAIVKYKSFVRSSLPMLEEADEQEELEEVLAAES